METITVIIDGEEHEVNPAELKLPEGYSLVTPNNVPDGLYTEEAYQEKIKERTKNTAKNAIDEALEDVNHHKRVLSKYNIALGDDGKPKGIKTDDDIDAIKKQVADDIRQEYEAKLEEKEGKLNKFLDRGKESAIIRGANKIGVDPKFLEPVIEGGSPYLIKELSDRFKYNDDIDDYALVEEDGTFKVTGNGFVTAGDYFERNKDQFKGMLKDERQRGSNFSKGGAGSGDFSGDPYKWSTKKKLDFINKNGRGAYKERLENAIQEEKAEKVKN